MKRQMTGSTHAQALSFEGFTKDEIADAYEACVINQDAFLSDTLQGIRLRQEAMKHFKDVHPECKTVEQLAMQADLEDDIDVKNACILKINAQAYAENALKSTT